MLLIEPETRPARQHSNLCRQLTANSKHSIQNGVRDIGEVNVVQTTRSEVGHG